jgi:hypothetical protein
LLIHNFLAYKANEEERKNLPNTQQESEQPNVKNVFFYKTAAYTSIKEGLEILERVDGHNLIIPFLRKALKWQNMSLLEIFEDLGTAAASNFTCTFPPCTLEFGGSLNSAIVTLIYLSISSN